MTDYTEADAAADIATVAKLAGAEPAVSKIIRAVLAERDRLRAENVRLAADLAAARTERDAGLVAMIESMTSHAEELRGKLDAVTAELDEARQAAADWRGLLACGWEEAEHVAHFIAWHHDEDCRREIPRHFAALNERAGMPAEVRDAARRLAAPHLNPPAEGGAK